MFAVLIVHNVVKSNNYTVFFLKILVSTFVYLLELKSVNFHMGWDKGEMNDFYDGNLNYIFIHRDINYIY